MNIEDLTEEQKAQFKTAKSPEEILEVAKRHGIELSLDELDSVSGGESWTECPKDTYNSPY